MHHGGRYMECGKLIIFVSYAPATGKSMAMLKYAKNLINSNARIKIASANWKNRDYLEHMIADMDVDVEKTDIGSSMRMNKVNHSVLSKDICDYAIFDEASFVDIDGSPIYEIIIKTLEKGISVLTTINMQKFTEVNAICRQYTKINICETIPISFLSRASLIIYINTDVTEVVDRYRKLKKINTRKRYLSEPVLCMYKKIIEQELQYYDYDIYENTTSIICEEAQSLAQKGIWVEPLFCKSKIRIKYQYATKDEDIITDYWRKENDANLAIPLSQKYNDFIVFDIDIKSGKNGLLELMNWEKENKKSFPLTSIVRTGTGGFHLYYKNKTGRKVKSIKDVLPGVDIRAEKAYVVVPPSIHPNGNVYCWIQGSIDTIVDSDSVVMDFLEEYNGLL